MTHTPEHGADGLHPDGRGEPGRPAVDPGAGDAPAAVPVPDGDEIAAFWHAARGRAGLGRLAVLVGPGARASVPPPAWAFGTTAAEADRELARVLDGSRRAVATARWELDDAGQPLPEPGDLSIVVDGRGHPRALLRTTGVRTVRFADVDAEHARLEGEGDGSLAAWTAALGERLRDVAARTGRVAGPDTEVVLERFEVRHPPRPRRRPGPAAI